MKHRLIWRIYLYGMVMLVLFIAASLAVGRYVIQPALEVPNRPSTTWIAWHVADIQDEPERLRAELDDLRERVGVQVSLFTPDGTLVASSAPSPPSPLAPETLSKLVVQETHFENGHGRVAIVGDDGKLENYVLVKYPQVSTLTTAAGQLVVALLVIALLAVPLARSVVRPVERLAEVTRAFGSGDHSARYGLRERPDEVGDLALAFDEMAERVTALRRAELELLANVSHELRTPLSRIRLALELILEGDVHKARAHVEDIAEELEELETLVDDVMTTARLDSTRNSSAEGVPLLRRESLSSRELLATASERFRAVHPEKQLDQRMCESEVTLHADPVLLRRAIDNLLDNATKYSEPQWPVVLESNTRDAHFQIRIIDRGIGISRGELDRIFEPFYRTDGSRARTTGGVGLGLALAKRIIEAHGGSIHARSDLGRGSVFIVNLPCEGALGS